MALEPQGCGHLEDRGAVGPATGSTGSTVLPLGTHRALPVKTRANPLLKRAASVLTRSQPSASWVVREVLASLWVFAGQERGEASRSVVVAEIRQRLQCRLALLRRYSPAQVLHGGVLELRASEVPGHVGTDLFGVGAGPHVVNDRSLDLAVAASCDPLAERAAVCRCGIDRALRPE